MVHPATPTAIPTATSAPGAAEANGLEALPVALSLGGRDAARVTAWVEGVLGWQPVVDATGLPPRVQLRDVAAEDGSGSGVPTVLLVAGGDDPRTVATAVCAAQPDEVLAWPDDRDTLPGVVAGLLARPHPAADDADDLRVGGAAGGVGTTTVALALGALAAWQQGPVLAVVHGSVPLAMARTIETDALAGGRTWEEAQPVPGIPGLRVVHADAPPTDVTILPPGEATTVVRDLGVDEEVDVLVVRRDATGVAAVRRSVAAAVVLVDDGVAPLGALRDAARGRRLLTVPRSVRVARAGYLRRVPAALPGGFLRELAPILPRRAEVAR